MIILTLYRQNFPLSKPANQPIEPTKELFMSTDAIGASSPVTIAPPSQSGATSAAPAAAGGLEEASAAVGQILTSIASGLGQAVDVMA